MIDSNERLGFHFFQIYVNIITGYRAVYTYSIISSVSLYLWSLSVGIFACSALHLPKKAVYVATLLFSLSALPLWVSFGGYGPQVLGMGLLILSLTLLTNAIQIREWHFVLAASMVSAAMAGVYSDGLPYLVVPAGIFLSINLWTSRKTNTSSIISMAGSIIVLTLLFNPIGWYRAFQLVMHRLSDTASGNVDWLIDPRQIFGLVPFDKDLGSWYGTFALNGLWAILTIVIFLVLFGLCSLKSSERQVILSFVIPHLGSLIWFYLNERTYGYFKGWTMGLFIYVILIAKGVYETLKFANVKGNPFLTAFAGTSLVIVIFLTSLSSIRLSTSIWDKFTVKTTFAEIGEWTKTIDTDNTIYVYTPMNDLSPVSVFWLTYFLKNHPTNFSVPIIYTNYSGQPYQDEQWIIRTKSSSPFWDTTHWDEIIEKENSDFILSRLDWSNRQFGRPNMATTLNANAGDLIELVGYDYLIECEDSGREVLKLALYWKARKKDR